LKKHFIASLFFTDRRCFFFFFFFFLFLSFSFSLSLGVFSSQLSTVTSQFQKLESFVSDSNEDSASAWSRVHKRGASAARAALVREWFAGSSSERGGPKGAANRTQSSLDTLVLAHQSVAEAQLATLRRQVPLLPQLTALDLQHTSLTDVSACVALEDVLGPKAGLKSVNLRGNDLGGKALDIAVATLKKGGLYKVPLRKLDLSLNAPLAKVPRAGQHLGDALKHNTTLHELAVTLDDVSTLPKTRGSSMIGNATQFVQSAFNSSTGCNETLCALRMTGTTLATKTIEALGKARGAAFRGALTELDLTSALIGPRGAFALVEALGSVRPRKACKLKTLILRGNALGAQGAEELGHLLRGNRTITTIDLRANQIGDEGASALGSALESRVLKRSAPARTTSPSRMSSRRFGPGDRRGGERPRKEDDRAGISNTRSRKEGKEVAHVLQNLLLGSNPLGVRGGEALLDAARKCTSLHDVGTLSAFVPAGLRQEISRVLAENGQAARQEDLDCGVVPFGQGCLLREKRERELREKREGGGGGEGDDGDAGRDAADPPPPALHTFPWVVTTETKAAGRKVGAGRAAASEADTHAAIAKSTAVDWVGWHRHYSVYLYRLGPASWKDDGGSECRGLDLEWEGFAACSVDPLHRMALESASAAGGASKASSSKGPMIGRVSTAPRTTSLFYRVVRQTSNEDLPYPGQIVQESLAERDDDDGLKFDVRLGESSAPWQVGDRLQVWVKAAGVAPEENTRVYTRNFAVTLPIKRWLGKKKKKRKNDGASVAAAAARDGTSQVLADQTFHQLNLYNGDSPFGPLFE
jgi:hypothetical protein